MRMPGAEDTLSESGKRDPIPTCRISTMTAKNRTNFELSRDVGPKGIMREYEGMGGRGRQDNFVKKRDEEFLDAWRMFRGPGRKGESVARSRNR